MQTYDWDDGGGDGNVVDVFMAVMEQYPPKWPRASQPLFSIKAEFKAAAAHLLQTIHIQRRFRSAKHWCSVERQKGRTKMRISIVAQLESQVDFALKHQQGNGKGNSFCNDMLEILDLECIPFALFQCSVGRIM